MHCLKCRDEREGRRLNKSILVMGFSLHLRTPSSLIGGVGLDFQHQFFSLQATCKATLAKELRVRYSEDSGESSITFRSRLGKQTQNCESFRLCSNMQ